MNETCGCCEGIERLTPVAIINRPGLDALIYRVGTHASFLETMLARLSNLGIPRKDLGIPLAEFDDPNKRIYPLQGLTTRTASDPAIAFLDAWATVADVLTFYQERIANESYLRTATERRSILELARLVGYTLRPGVGASVYLAYTLEKDHDVTILPGNRAQSVPDPGELPQSFETAEPLEARFAWNTLKPRLTRPQFISLVPLSPPGNEGKIDTDTIYAQGTATGLKAGDSLLFIFDNSPAEIALMFDDLFTEFAFHKVISVEPQAAEDHTKVKVDSPPTRSESSLHRTIALLASRSHLAAANGNGKVRFREIVGKLEIPPSLQPRNSQQLSRSAAAIFDQQSDIQQQLLVNLSPALQPTLYSAVANAQATSPSSLPLKSVQALRVKAAPFGHNAPLQQDFERGVPVGDPHEWKLTNAVTIHVGINLIPSPSSPPGPGILLAAIGGGAGVTFGGITFTSMAVSFTQDQHTWTGEVVIEGGGHDATLVDTDGQPGPTVHIDVSASEIVFTFQIGVERPTTHITNVDSTHAAIRLEPDPPIVVAQPSGATPYKTAHHNTTIEFNAGEGLSITDESVAVLDGNMLPLDAVYDKITPESWVVVERPDRNIFSRVKRVQTVSIAAYGLTGRVTQLTLDQDWLEPTDRLLSDIRGITIYAQSEKIEQAEEPIDEDIADTAVPPGRTASAAMSLGMAESMDAAGNGVGEPVKAGTDTIELDRLYDGLKPGRRLILSGERTDLLQPDGEIPIPGVKASELVMLASVTQGVQKIHAPDGTSGFRDIDLPGDKTHTFLHLAEKLAYTYKRDTVTIYGNVVRATHGETRTETLGSGDGSKTLQRFTLHQSPLTYLAAPTPAGAESTLQVRVNDILWHEADSLADLGPTDRSYTTETDDASKTTVIFGNGQYGTRLPTGVENVKAVYPTGIGKPGNVRAGQITLLATKPLGVKSVVNPQRASGGADRESRDSARRNVPLALLALDRLVSVEDYEDFARTYAGIGKASAARLSNGRRQLVHLSIVGADNIPIDKNSDLYLNLVQALQQLGDPNLPLQVDLCEVMFIVISAKVRLLPDYALEFVEPKIRAALLDYFSFERRELGQPVFKSEVFSVIQAVPGVEYVELEIMDAVDEERVLSALDTPSPGESSPPDSSPPMMDEGASTESSRLIGSLGLGLFPFIDVKLARIDLNATDPAKRILPAQLAFLSPDVPDTLILTEIPQ